MRLHRRRRRARVQGRQDRVDDRHGRRPLDRQLAGDAAHVLRARRALHDADAQRQPALGRCRRRQAGARRPDEVRRRSRARDEPARHARRSQPRLARHDGRRAARDRGAGDLLALVGARDLQRASQRARQHPADGREERRRGDGDVRARLHLAGGRRLRREAGSGAQGPDARRRRRCRRSPITSITSARSPASITSASAATSTASRRWSRASKTCRSIRT